MNTKLIRMKSGEDVICDVLEQTTETLTIANAIVAVPAGQGQLGFAPWSPLSNDKDTLTIKESYTVYITVPNDNVKQQYESLFSTVITPSKKLIV